jgi:hypothetical protein
MVRFAVGLSLVFSFAPSALAQDSDSRALAYVAQSTYALTGGNQIRDALNGSALWTHDDNSQSGPAAFLACPLEAGG